MKEREIVTLTSEEISATTLKMVNTILVQDGNREPDTQSIIYVFANLIGSFYVMQKVVGAEITPEQFLLLLNHYVMEYIEKNTGKIDDLIKVKEFVKETERDRIVIESILGKPAFDKKNLN